MSTAATNQQSHDVPTGPAASLKSKKTVQRKERHCAWIFIVASISACSIYANLSFAVTDATYYQYFPPFIKGFDGNKNLTQGGGAEYYNIAKSLVAGEGFANPFNNAKTGPTAWMTPVLPAILAALLWVCNGSHVAVIAVLVVLQVCVLIGTGILILALIGKTTTRITAFPAALIFMGGVLCDFYLWFQRTHDYWLVLLTVDLLIAGCCWCRPLHNWKIAAIWGTFGGFCAMVNPIVGVAWAVLSVGITFRERTWRRIAIALLTACLAVAPWCVRNYLIFGRLIPLKSNLAYELYQSQCLQKDGLLQNFAGHPYSSNGPERQQFKALGEMAFLDKKRAAFWEAAAADPFDLTNRIAYRFLGVTLLYVPLHRDDLTARPWVIVLARISHPLPCLGFVFLGYTALLRPLRWEQVVIMAIYVLYLLPYIIISYYDRYAMPLLGVKILLVIWAADSLLSLRRATATS